MSVMVLLVLAVVWVVALTPMILRKLSERQVLTSVTSFNSRLGYLRSRNSGYGRQLLALAPIGFSAAAERLHQEPPRFDAGVRPGPTTAEPEVPQPVASRRTIHRRRRVVVALAGGTLVCFLFGLVPALSFFWYLAFAGLFLGAVYVALLVHFHRLAVERAQKVVALETRRQVLTALEEARVVGVAAGGASTWAITGSHPGGGARGSRSGSGSGSKSGSEDRVTFAGVANRR